MNFLTLIVALMPFFSFALVSPTIVKANDNKQNLTIVYHKANSDITVEVLSGDDLVGRACSFSLNSGSFEKLPIIFDVDERGSGNLTIGLSTYLIHENVSYSGGIVCARLFNHAEAAVSCTVAVPMDLPLKQLTESGIAECISGGHSSLARFFLPTAASPSLGSVGVVRAGWTPPWANDGDDINPHCGTWDSTEPLSDGDPHQNYYLVQLSENMFCGAAPGCTVGYTESEGVTITFSVNTDFGSDGWISAGFSVAKQWITGSDYHCDGGRGDTVCVWYNTAHTAYTVRHKSKNRCSGEDWFSDPFINSSPNTDNVGGGQYCVIGACQHKEFWYWDRDGRAGGP